jgi:[ribosomal protein S5]-alanine N-acetyltransferase
MIVLQELTKRDCSELLKFELDNREYFEKFVPARHNDYYSLDAIEETAENMIMNRETDEYYLFLIKDRNGQIVGRMNIYDITRTLNSGQIGYRIGERHAGKGYATQAVKLAIMEARDSLNLSRLEAKVMIKNPSSSRVLEKAGFDYIEMLKQELPFGNLLKDARLYRKAL